MTSSTPEAPDPGTQVEISQKLATKLKYAALLHRDKQEPQECWVEWDDYVNELEHAMKTARQSPTVALTNDRDEEETR